MPDLERFGPYAREAAEGAAGILVGSGHIAERLRRAVDEPEINAKVRLGPPGVDTELFSPIPAVERPARRSKRSPTGRALTEPDPRGPGQLLGPRPSRPPRRRSSGTPRRAAPG